MELKANKPPRLFTCGLRRQITIADCGEIRLAADEQVTFVTYSNKRYDVVAKEWGFYATPSLDGRLKTEGFKSALVRNSVGRHYIMLVENEKLELFFQYLEKENQQVIKWLDEPLHI